MKRRLATIAIAAVLGVSGWDAAQAAESQLAEFFRLRREAEALAAKDPAEAVKRLEAAHRLHPASPGTLVQLAAAQLGAGDRAGAVASLDDYARFGLTLDLAQRPELLALRGQAGFDAVEQRLAANARPQGRIAWTAPIEGTGPLEGVAYDPRTRTLYLSLVGGRAVLAGGAKAGFTVRTGPEAAGGGVFGIAWDARRKALWATVAVGEQVPGAEKEPDASALLRIDPASGKVAARYAAPTGVRLGDVVVGPDGTVYASDGRGGRVLRLRPDAAGPDVLAGSPEMGSAQGLAVRGRALVVADYPSGLHRIDLDTGAVEAISAPSGLTLVGVDGLADDGKSLYATQNGVFPHRILRLRLSPDARRVVSAETVLSGQRDAADIALAAVVGRELVFSARSGWESGASPVLAGVER